MERTMEGNQSAGRQEEPTELSSYLLTSSSDRHRHSMIAQRSQGPLFLEGGAYGREINVERRW